MKKKYLLMLCLTVLMALLLGACGESEANEAQSAKVPKNHEHTWTEATCNAPKTCSDCGETEGSALSHSWTEATCSAPKTCKLCGKTEGTATEHDYMPATLEAPKTCKACGATEGAALEIIKADLSRAYEADWYSINSGFEKFVTLDRASLAVNAYDFYGNHLGTTYIVPNEDLGMWNLYTRERYTIIVTYYLDYPDVPEDGSEAYWDVHAYIEIYDEKMEQIYGRSVMIDSIVNMSDDLRLSPVWEKDRILSFYFETTDSTLYIDPAKGEEYTPEEFAAIEEEEDPKYTNPDWYYYSYDEGTETYTVSPQDQSYWGYLDKNGNELARFADASDFCPAGYALVSNDRMTYDLVDKDMNVVVAGFAEGKSASCSLSSGWLSVTGFDDNKSYYFIK